MKYLAKRLVLALLGAALISPASAGDYFPPKGDGWTRHTPQQEKFDPAKLKAAIDYAISAELQYPPELAKVADIRDLRVSVPLKYTGEAFSSPTDLSSATAISWWNGATRKAWT